MTKDIRFECIKVFGTSNEYDADDDGIAYYRKRRLIGTDARDYWYDEAAHFFSEHSYYAKMNDSYFCDIPFNGPIEYKRKLDNRISYWVDLLKRDLNYQKAISCIENELFFLKLNSVIISSTRFVLFRKFSSSNVFPRL